MLTYRIIQERPDSIGFILQEKGLLWGWNYVKWFKVQKDAEDYLDELRTWIGKGALPKVIKEVTILERFD